VANRAAFYSLLAIRRQIGGARQVVRRAPLTHQPACKPGFVRWGLAPPRDGHSSVTPVARRLKQPTRTAGSGHGSRRLPSLSLGQASRRPYSVLLPVGFAVPPALPQPRCALTAPFHPYPPSPEAPEGGLFSVALSLGSRPPDVIRHRMSMEPGLSSRTCLSALVQAAVQPTDHIGMGCERPGVKVRSRSCTTGGTAGGVQLVGVSVSRASYAATRDFRVARVETSTMPSTRCGRKWR